MKAKLVVLLAMLLFGRVLLAQNSADVVTYINTYKEFAMSEMQRSGVPAAIILAQGIHETEAGTSELVRKSNNHFGIKCKDSWTGLVVYHDDDAKGECFRSYTTPLDSYKDHSDFLLNSPRYAFLFKLDAMDYEAWAYGLKKAGYATNNYYPQILIKLIRDYNLQQYTLIAMGKLKPSDEILAVDKNAPAVVPATVTTSIATTDKNVAIHLPPAPQYPEGEFTINNTRVIFARAGTSLLSVADQYSVTLGRLLDFNDLKEEDVLVKDQLMFLQRKRKTGANDIHIVQSGETLYDICQTEGIRYESLLELNQLVRGMQPAVGEKIYLQSASPSRPALADGKNKPTVVLQDTDVADTNSFSSTTLIKHTVQVKETLYSISKKYGVEVEQVRQWNKLDSAGLRVGQELFIYKN